MKQINKKLYKISILSIVIVFVMYFFYKYDIYDYIRDREKLEIFIKEYGVWGQVIYGVIYIICTIFCVSVLPLTLAGTFVFGILKTIIITLISASVGLSISFFIARYIFKESLESKFLDRKIYGKINKGVEEQGWFIVAITRLIPLFPFGIQNYIYGLTNISFISYWFFSTIFILPGVSIFISFAGAIVSGDRSKMMKISSYSILLLLILIVIVKFVSQKAKKIGIISEDDSKENI